MYENACKLMAKQAVALEVLSFHATAPTEDAEKLAVSDIHRGSYMSAHVLLNLLNELGNRDKMQGLPSIFATSLINSIIQQHEC